MLFGHKLILDTFCEVYDQLKPWADDDFFDFSSHTVCNNAIYLIGRAQINHNTDKIIDIIENDTAKIIFSNPAEGSETLLGHVTRLSILKYIKQHRVLLIGGGDMEPDIPCLQYDSFLPKIQDYSENITAMARYSEIYEKPIKPYKFLFLNGRSRPHRKYLINEFAASGTLQQALWTNLDGYDHSNSRLGFSGSTQLKYLDPYYEVDRYRDQIGKPTTDVFAKHHLFSNEWGEIYLKAEPYIDTYFSLVTETVVDYPYSFRTEKIWKPIAMCHPWIAVANTNYYRDMRNLGFKTFHHLIDEGFDSIANTQDRLNRISSVVEDLCRQDLPSFLSAAREICEYNQQHLAIMRDQVRAEFSCNFFTFLKTYWHLQ
jgi:hypothetical protein